MTEIHDVIIIGSGPAGYTAGIYLSRAKMSPLLFAGEEWGGQLMLTTGVENYPGFKEGIQGPELMSRMRKQAESFGTEILDKNVSKVDFSQKPFKVWIDEGQGKEEYQAKSVIIATGARARMLEIGEEKLLGRGVSTCAVCDAHFFKDKVTFVAGGGDAAMEEALALLKHAKKVGIIHRRDKFRASRIMQDRVLKKHKDKVDVLWDTKVVGVKGENKLEEIVVENNNTGERRSLKTDGLFLAIGHIPSTGLFQDQLKLDRKGHLVTRLNSLESQVPEEVWIKGYPTMTSVEGVFGAGDVVDFRYRQAVTAAGFGCMAALDAERWLERRQE